MKDWQNEAEVALEELRRCSDNPCYGHLLNYLRAELEMFKDEMCQILPDSKDLELRNTHASIFKNLLDVLDPES